MVYSDVVAGYHESIDRIEKWAVEQSPLVGNAQSLYAQRSIAVNIWSIETQIY